MPTKESSFNWGQFFIGLLFIITALASFQNPTGSLEGLTLFIGIIAILNGLFNLFIRNRLKIVTGGRTTLIIIVGILDILFGVLLLLNPVVGFITLPYLFALWFLVDSISNLFTLDLAKSISTAYYWFNLIINILGVIVGIMLLFDSLTSALTLSFLVGFYLMWTGLLLVIEAFTK